MDLNRIFEDFVNEDRRISICQKEKYFDIINDNLLYQSIMWYFNRFNSVGSVYHVYTQIFNEFIVKHKDLLNEKSKHYSNDLIKNCIVEYTISISDEIPNSCVIYVIDLLVGLGAKKLKLF
jgi:hypothetical protein